MTGTSLRGLGTGTRARAWLVTGPLGRGLAFAIDFSIAVRRGLFRRCGPVDPSI
jgi:hypothetical protein